MRSRRVEEPHRWCVVLMCWFAGFGLLVAGMTQQVLALSTDEPAVSSTRTVLIHSDEGYENAYRWYGQSPDWGAFAEEYSGCYSITAIVLDITATDFDLGECDLYIWGDAGGHPGDVLFVLPDVSPYWFQYWPQFARNMLELPEPVPVEGTWWVGYWGGLLPGFFIGADLNGPGGGCPMIRMTPGQGHPEGWQDVSIVWGPTAALGIGAEVEEGPPSPVSSQTWGSIKTLFR